LNTTSSGLYISPILALGAAGTNYLQYNTSTFEVNSNSGKTFIIDHPIITKSDRYLVHACLEGPEAGVFYRGKGEITNNYSTTITLPDYVNDLATDLTIQVIAIYNGVNVQSFNISEVENNQFNIYGRNGRFHWIVHGKRCDFDVEPLKNETSVSGSGPYTYIVPT